MNKRTAVVSALLLAGLIAAVAGATAALRLVGNGSLGPGGKPRTEADIQRSLAQPAPSPSRSQPPSQAAPRRSTPSPRPATTSTSPSSFASAGGTVFASCSAGQVTLASWIPAQGYGTDGVYRGPARATWVKFKSGGTELTVTVTCAHGQPRFTTAAENSGGGHGGGGGGGGGSGGGGS